MNVVFFLLGDSPASEYADVSVHSVYSKFIECVSRKNNRDEIVGFYIQVWLKIAWANRKEGDEEGVVRIEDQTAEGKDPKWRSIINMDGRKGVLTERGRWAVGW